MSNSLTDSISGSNDSPNDSSSDISGAIKQPLFFYGTLKAAEIREAVLGYSVPDSQLEPARLFGFQVRRVAGAFYPMLIEAAAEAVVEGVIMTVTSRQDLDRLDRFEGSDYRRVEASAIGADGPRQIQIFQPAPHLQAAELWDFQRWYETDLDNFLAQDFDLDGVRRP